MSLLGRRHKLAPSFSEKSHDIRVEVVVEKEANRQVAKEAKEANRTLNKLLEANHFTIKIYRATRSSAPKGRT